MIDEEDDDDGITIRPATPSDRPSVLRIARGIVEEGTTYSFPPETTDQELIEYFLAPESPSFVAEREGAIVGCYVLRANRSGRGSHVANASYAVDGGAQGTGVGYAMGRHSLDEARRRGFLAIQFNFVVATNERAVALWQRLGFETVGRLPRAFRHPTRGLVDALVMHRFL
jgi:L-amino acid N-acyltransferase YncA